MSQAMSQAAMSRPARSLIIAPRGGQDLLESVVKALVGGDMVAHRTPAQIRQAGQ
jgi:hypothetical protein